ncbi:hypothetical protein [Okeania sp. KiyG1]|uniref:hypothetical protein n=1 Tax=Okeania sp. KiyG1 TaxID=2720165 RepID=UPI001922C655|nr:hypothetical protein [Okeania sp. KiyG1]
MVGNCILSLTKLWASLSWKKSINTTIITKFYIRSSAQQILRTVAESHTLFRMVLLLPIVQEKYQTDQVFLTTEKKGNGYS